MPRPGRTKAIDHHQPLYAIGESCCIPRCDVTAQTVPDQINRRDFQLIENSREISNKLCEGVTGRPFTLTVSSEIWQDDSGVGKFTFKRTKTLPVIPHAMQANKGLLGTDRPQVRNPKLAPYAVQPVATIHRRTHQRLDSL
jgi:hypothetical protein